MLSGLIRQGIVQDGLHPLVHIGLKYGNKKKDTNYGAFQEQDKNQLAATFHVPLSTRFPAPN